MKSIEYRFGPLPVALALIAAVSLFAPALPAQDEPGASGSTAEPRVATIEELQAFLEQQSADEEAARSDRAAAEQGDADAQLRLGRHYFTGSGVPRDDAEGVLWVRLAAEQGHADAQFTLASAYSLGRGVAKDEAEAMRWRLLAAEQGHIGAQIVVGGRYSDGRGAIKDVVEGARWYRRAAEQGDVSAQFMLGAEYAMDDVLENYVLAHMWLNVASANGAELAGDLRDRIQSSMTREQIIRATELAQACMANDFQDCEP